MTAFVLTSQDARRRAAAAASRLAGEGLRAGDRLAVIAPGPELPAEQAAVVQGAVVCLVWGALAGGIIPVMVNPLLSAEERADYLASARVAGHVADPKRLLALTDPGQGPTAAFDGLPLGRPMHFTSGTTGRSKGVWSAVLTEDQARDYWDDEHSVWRIEAGDRVLNHGPLAHSAPLRFSLLAVCNGADVIFTGPFDAVRTAAAIANHRPTVAMAVPTHLQRLLALPGGPPPSSYRLLAHAGAACPPDLKRMIHTWAGAENVWEFLGSTEGQFTACRGSEWENRPGTLGRARPGRRLWIDDGSAAAPGVIWCATPDFAAFEYFDDPDKTAAAWRTTAHGDRAFTVGDLGYLDDQGYLFLRGRRTDLIITGGVNVYPAEVEAALRECPGVHDAAVFGVPDPTWGDRVCAAIVGEATPEEVRLWCAEHLASYRRPKSITRVPELPLTNNGKVRREGLAEWVATHDPANTGPSDMS